MANILDLVYPSYDPLFIYGHAEISEENLCSIVCCSLKLIVLLVEHYICITKSSISALHFVDLFFSIYVQFFLIIIYVMYFSSYCKIKYHECSDILELTFIDLLIYLTFRYNGVADSDGIQVCAAHL